MVSPIDSRVVLTAAVSGRSWGVGPLESRYPCQNRRTARRALHLKDRFRERVQGKLFPGGDWSVWSESFRRGVPRFDGVENGGNRVTCLDGVHKTAGHNRAGDEVAEVGFW
jgi:hypothetical protein